MKTITAKSRTDGRLDLTRSSREAFRSLAAVSCLLQYLPPAQKTIKDHGGVNVAAGPGTQIDGSFPKGRVVILRWEGMEALQAWRHSPEYEKIRNSGRTLQSTMSW